MHKSRREVEVQLAHSLQLRLVSSLALTAENWEPCVHITQGMVRAKGLEGSKIEEVPLSTQI